jgi:hypothetical protein
VYLWQLWHYCIIFINDTNSHQKKFNDQNFVKFYWIFRNILFVETKISEVINYLKEMCPSCQCTTIHPISEDHLSCFGFHIEVWRFIIWYKQFCSIPAKNSEFEHISSCFDLRKFPPLCYHGNYALRRFGYKNVQISMFTVYTTTQYLLGLEQVFFFTLKRHTHQTSKASESLEGLLCATLCT